VYKRQRREIFILAALLVAAVLAIEVLPRLFGSGMVVYGRVPPAGVLVSVGLALSLCTVAGLQLALTRIVSFPRLALWFVVVYNVLIILVKFTLGPLALWQPTYESQLGSVGVAIGQSLGIFLLYALAFCLVGGFFWVRTLRHILGGTKAEPWHRRIPMPLSLLVTGLVMLFASLVFLGIMVAPWLSADPYLQALLSGVLGSLVGTALAAALTFGGLGFWLTSRRAIVLRDAGLLSALFWIGLGLLALYHVLWVFYIVALAAIWPLKIFVPK